MPYSIRLVTMGTRWYPQPVDSDIVYLQNIVDSDADVSNDADKCRYIFDQYDEMKCGEISLWNLRQMLRDPELRSLADWHTLQVLEMKCIGNLRSSLTYQEFVNIISNRRNTSFRLAVENEGKPKPLIPVDNYQWPYRGSIAEPEVASTCFNVMVRRIARDFLTDELDRKYYEDKYTCCPPPVFVPIITFIEVGCFIYYCIDCGSITVNGPLPVNSALIYRPDRRIELWRFLLYMFIHAGWVHLFFNMLIQIVVGIPLEMVHGSYRIATVYTAGVMAGSLGTSVFDTNAFLVGASGGVYALLAGHIANILLNYSQMEFGYIKLGAVLIIGKKHYYIILSAFSFLLEGLRRTASADVGFAVWDRYTKKTSVAPPVSYTAHLMGALAGLTIGLVVLKNFEQKLHEQYLWWIALAIYLACIVFAIFWNLFYY